MGRKGGIVLSETYGHVLGDLSETEIREKLVAGRRRTGYSSLESPRAYKGPTGSSKDIV